MSNICGQSPLFIPTTINAQIKNIDAVDVACTNLSCKTFSIDGEPINTILQNVDESQPGVTRFTGQIQSDSLQVAGDITQTTGTTTVQDVTINGTLTLNDEDVGSQIIALNTRTGYQSNIGSGTKFTNEFRVVSASGSTVLVCNQNDTNPSVEIHEDLLVTSATTISGDITQQSGNTILRDTAVNSLQTSGNISQSSGITTLQDTAVTSLYSSGTTTLAGVLSQTSGSTTLQGTTINGNITQTAGNTALLDTSIDGTLLVDDVEVSTSTTLNGPVLVAGNITQNSGTTSLQGTSMTTLTVNGTAIYPVKTGTTYTATGTDWFKDLTFLSTTTSATLYFSNLKTNGANIPRVTIGNSTTQSTTYIGCTQGLSLKVANSTYINLFDGWTANTCIATGEITFTKLSATTWSYSGIVARTDTPFCCQIVGQATVSGTVDRVQLSTGVSSQAITTCTALVKYS